MTKTRELLGGTQLVIPPNMNLYSMFMNNIILTAWDPQVTDRYDAPLTTKLGQWASPSCEGQGLTYIDN